jgi:hypothetical protein
MWFTASIFHKGQHTNQPSADMLWEESLVLLEADSAEEALAMAEAIGCANCTSYETVNGDRVEGQFERVERVYEVDSSPVNGTELFSRFLRNSEAVSLLTPFSE